MVVRREILALYVVLALVQILVNFYLWYALNYFIQVGTVSSRYVKRNLDEPSVRG